MLHNGYYSKKTTADSFTQKKVSRTCNSAKFLFLPENGEFFSSGWKAKGSIF